MGTVIRELSGERGPLIRLKYDGRSCTACVRHPCAYSVENKERWVTRPGRTVTLEPGADITDGEITFLRVFGKGSNQTGIVGRFQVNRPIPTDTPPDGPSP